MKSNSSDNSGCLGAIFPFLNHSNVYPDYQSISKPLPYRLRDDFLSPAEFSFSKVLSQAVAPQLIIQSKVRLADVLFVARPNENFSFFGRIAQKHLDFLACEAVTMKPVFAVELDDASHQQDKRQKRDLFVEEACQAAGLPLIKYSAQRTYNMREVKAEIDEYLVEDVERVFPTEVEANEVTNPMPICPKCGIRMVLRTASRGDFAGKQFYGCTNFPQCREVKPYTPTTKQETVE